MKSKTMKPEEFRLTGLLFELNRQILHPHGFALAVGFASISKIEGSF